MKKKTVQFIVLFMLTSSIQSQNYVNALRIYFQNEKPYDAYDFYYKNQTRFSKEDYKLLYYDKEMKNYLLKWLNQEQILDYKTSYYKKTLSKFKDKSYESTVKDYITSTFKLNADSIRADAALWELYTDSVINSYVDRWKTSLLKRKEEEKRDMLPDEGVLYLHAMIVYPESYKIIKDWWYQYDKPIAEGRIDFDNLLMFLLLMNDPEAQSEFDKIVRKYVQTNGEVHADNYSFGFINCFELVNNAYGIKKMVELLPVQTKMPGLSSREGTSYVPFDYRIYNLLAMVFNKYGINTAGLFNDISTMRKNKDEIIRLANQLIQKLEEDEKYWMENMPFDYVPDVTSNK